VSKIFVNEIIVANTGHSPPRHARESGHPENTGLSSGAWIPAFAGMTKLGYLATGASHALTSLMFETVNEGFKGSTLSTTNILSFSHGC